MADLRPTAAPVFATTIILAAALIAREVLRSQLVEAGYAASVAKDLSYLVVPVTLAVMIWPILRQHWTHLRHVFRIESLTPRVIICGILIGVLLRAAWWSSLVAGISIGLVGDANPGPAIGPTFRFACPAPGVLLLSITVTALLIPLIEETLHRGLILSGLLHRGRLVAILVSTLIFMLFHSPTTYLAVFLIGLVLALQYARTGAIWFALASHATYNALIQLDWYCLNGKWHPSTEQLPLTNVGLASVLILSIAAGLLYWLLKVVTPGAPRVPRT